MQLQTIKSNGAPKTDWLATALTFVGAFVAIAALALFGVDETRALLLG
ncbi:MAG TPA: hypothetical protein VKA18_12655 [Alphaproteobacteria bacterium]|nr:hypothetical protein [Alphaproteobacteria bacterium]